MKDTNPPKSFDGGIAVGAYLRYMRVGQGLQATDIAEKISTDQTQVWRIEHWKSDVRSTLLFKYVRAVGADVNDIEMLINNPDATKADGESLAKLRLGMKQK